MPTNFEMVKLWHETFGVPAPSSPTLLSPARASLRVGLIDEERDEYVAALRDGDIVEIADALVDLLYVTYGALVEHGLPADKLFQEVQRSNMSKLDENGKPLYRSDGKVLKSNLFTPPDLASIINSPAHS